MIPKSRFHSLDGGFGPLHLSFGVWRCFSHDQTSRRSQEKRGGGFGAEP